MAALFRVVDATVRGNLRQGARALSTVSLADPTYIVWSPNTDIGKTIICGGLAKAAADCGVRFLQCRTPDSSAHVCAGSEVQRPDFVLKTCSSSYSTFSTGVSACLSGRRCRFCQEVVSICTRYVLLCNHLSTAIYFYVICESIIKCLELVCSPLCFGALTCLSRI